MKHKIKYKYLLRMILFLAVTMSAMILIYYLFAGKFYMHEIEKRISNFYEEIKTMNLEKLDAEEYSKIDEITRKGYCIGIYENGSDEPIYDFHNLDEEESELEEYDENNDSLIQNDGEAIYVYGKIFQNETEYLIHIEMRIKKITEQIRILNQFSIILAGIIIVIGGPFSLYMANKTIKPVEKLSDMTRDMKNNKFNDKDEYLFPEDEIGELSELIKDMYAENNNYINGLQNYNYLLFSENRNLIEFDEQRKNFIRMATHELKTPLAIISSELELLQLDYPEELSKYYDSIMEEINKMSNLIRNMLKNSFKEDMTSKIELQKEDFSLLMNNMKEKYESWMRIKKIRCQFEFQNNIFIYMDKDSVEHAVNNYIINACEHTSAGGKVVVTLEEKNKKAVLSVYNEGEHIKESKIEKIWEKFYSNDKAEFSSISSNVGLGLYIVNDIVKKHKGECYVENREGGVAFSMVFDIAK